MLPQLRSDAGGVALLGRAVDYTRGSLALVAPRLLRAPTPCRDWDLRALLRHMDDSLAALTEAAELGYVDLRQVPDSPVSRPAEDSARVLVDRLRERACALLGAWTGAPADRLPRVHDRPVPADLLARAGAVEIAVHGWDVAAACGGRRPLPEPLARALLDVVPAVVSAADRPLRFAAPVGVPREAAAATRLLGLLGRAAA